MEFMPHNAPLVVLSFLGVGFLTAVAGLWLLFSLFTGKRERALKIVAGLVAAWGSYGGVLLTASLASDEKVLAAGQQKYFCEIDCHVAYSVESVVTAKTLGSGASQASAKGTFYVVTVKTWFDERTISSRRPKDASLWPNPRIVFVVDEHGRKFSTSLDGQKALERAGGVPLTQSLKPGESYTTTLIFDLPTDATHPHLLLTDLDPITHLLIGHENSFFHKKIYFDLEPAAVRQEKQSRAAAGSTRTS